MKVVKFILFALIGIFALIGVVSVAVLIFNRPPETVGATAIVDRRNESAAPLAGVPILADVSGTTAIIDRRGEQSSTSLDYSKPLVTLDKAVVCPPGVFFNDPREGHSTTDVLKVYFDQSGNRGQHALEMGCEEWHEDIPVVPVDIKPGEKDPRSGVDLSIFKRADFVVLMDVDLSRFDAARYLVTRADELRNKESD